MQVITPTYYRLRGFLRRQEALGPIKPFLARSRNLVLAGPLRSNIVAYHRAVTRNKPMPTNTLPWVEPFDTARAAHELHANGFAAGMRVTDECVERLLKCYETKPVQSYNNPHRDHPFILEIARNERLVEVARQYLQAEPIFLESRLHSYTPGKSHNPPCFHYDAGDAASVTFFVFLTDVDDEMSVTHQVVAGTHRGKTFKELWTRELPDEVAPVRYPGRVHTIMGPRGTAWFEDTMTFHKHGYVGRLRKCLSLLYVLRRQQ
jgi:hypothetical protein